MCHHCRTELDQNSYSWCKRKPYCSKCIIGLVEGTLEKKEITVTVDIPIILKSGVPCTHPGCINNNKSHPCEKCSRILDKEKIMKVTRMPNLVASDDILKLNELLMIIESIGSLSTELETQLDKEVKMPRNDDAHLTTRQLRAVMIFRKTPLDLMERLLNLYSCIRADSGAYTKALSVVTKFKKNRVA